VRALTVEGDVSSSEDVDKLVSKTLEKFGKIDILVHCVGIRGPAGSFLDLEEDTWRMMIDVNLTGAFLVGKAVAKAMLPDSEGKKIVLISSTAGIQAAPEIASYCAAKHGLQGLMKCMAVGLAKYKINVNAILPMSFDTNFRDAQMKVDADSKGAILTRYHRQDRGANQDHPHRPPGHARGRGLGCFLSRFGQIGIRFGRIAPAGRRVLHLGLWTMISQ
jgi:NAD(P)-dependent dehydrogenase (short-subunit alcohol dehydrogenase family)